MSTTEEATVNADGTTTFESTPPVNDDAFNATEQDFPPEDAEEILEEVVKGIDPAIYLVLFLLIVGIVYFYVSRRNKKEEDDFFSAMDGEKFNLKLPSEVEEYYQIRAKAEASGWEPGKDPGPGDAQNPNGTHRILAQALMKRCIADIPIVTHIQKESAGMNKLYSQSMCSVKQWQAYQHAEAMVSQEVAEVRAEADDIEPGWSQVIWRQGMQYHNMLKQKHEMEAKEAAEEAAKQKALAEKRKAIEEKVNAEQKRVADAKAEELAAEKAARELIKAEEREKQSKKAFKGDGSMKKGFLEKKK